MMNPLTLRMISFQVMILMALAFGILAWIARPEGAWIWAFGMATLPLAWLGLHLFGAMPPKDRPEKRRLILNSLNGAGLLIVGALGASALGSMGTIEESWILRYAMITNALVLVVIGNGLPKKIEAGCSRSRGLATQRLLGWTFVIGGGAQALLWLLIPAPEEAGAFLTFGVYAAMVVVVTIGLWRIRGEAAKGSPTS